MDDLHTLLISALALSSLISLGFIHRLQQIVKTVSEERDIYLNQRNGIMSALELRATELEQATKTISTQRRQIERFSKELEAITANNRRRA
jgi:hypothetical protein